MAIERDESIALPSPPPPRPAARRAAIESALRKFDGIEEAPAKRAARRRPSPIAWATMHRRPAGALMTAVLIAVIGIPAAQIALRDQSREVASDTAGSNLVQPGQEVAINEASPASEIRQADSGETVAAAEPPPPAKSAISPIPAAEDRAALAPASTGSDQLAAKAPSPVPVISAPPPAAMAAAPPPPPPPAPQAVEDGNIVVTGSRIRRPELTENAYADRAAQRASPLAVIDPYGEILSRLQAAFRSNDRRAVIRLIGFPLRIAFDGETRTYRSSRDVTRDFDRIFTPQVRAAALNQRPEALVTQGGGRMLSNGRIGFGPTCSGRSCSQAPIRIREVTP